MNQGRLHTEAAFNSNSDIRPRILYLIKTQKEKPKQIFVFYTSPLKIVLSF